MIYTYRYLESRIEQFHDNIAYFFERLFVLNPVIFDEADLFRPSFLPMVKASKTTLLKQFETITSAYHTLTYQERILVQAAFRNNNDIETICRCGCVPHKYTELPAGIREPLKKFFLSLWESYPQNQEVQAAYGTIKNHFDAFVNQAHQQALLCPFCGIDPLQPSGGDYRDAYDHFIPKAVYPFNSVNFRNLVPICYDCNSNAKKAKDVPFDDTGNPRPVTYPYNNQPGRVVEAHIICLPEYNYAEDTRLSDTKPMWYITLTESGITTGEMESWNAIYNITKRYQNRIGQFEQAWWKEMIKRYKRHRHVSFADFRADILDDYGDLTAMPMAILRKAYYTHLFSMPDLDELLSATVS